MKTHDYIHHYRGYWSDGGKCRIRIYRENGHEPSRSNERPPEGAVVYPFTPLRFPALEPQATHALGVLEEAVVRGNYPVLGKGNGGYRQVLKAATHARLLERGPSASEGPCRRSR